MLRLRRSFGGWFTHSGDPCEQTAPIEAVVLRCFGAAFLLVCAASTFTTRPRPGLDGRGAIVLAALLLVVASAVAAQPHQMRMLLDQPQRTTIQRQLIAALLGVIVGSVVLALEQPNGIWQVGPYFVAIMAAVRLDRRSGALMLLAGVAPFVIGAAIKGDTSTAISMALGVAPWYLVMRLMRRMIEQRNQLTASRAAEARAAVAAERGRIAREMHDVLAHSLSALALQLESTRLLARDRAVDPEIARALDQAHSLAASGLDDARRAIAAARGDELPGPERLETLAGAFGDQSGLPVAVEVHGSPRELPPDARLAVYRTAQEALTNVRRHAAAERVRVSLDYQHDSTVLVVEDHAAAGTPPPVAPVGAGYGLTGMRERAKLLGGELLASPTDGGFRVELRLPA